MINPNEIHDQDGNVIRRGMAVVSEGETYVVNRVSNVRGNWAVILDRPRPDGTLAMRCLIGRRRLYLVHVIGYQIPQVL